MSADLTYDAVREGDDLPERKRTPTTFRVMRFLGATWFWGPQFHDPKAAARMGLAGPIVPGPMKFAYMSQYLHRAFGGAGDLRRLQLSHRRPDLHDAEMTFGGSVTRKYDEDGTHFLDVELFIDNPEGERSVRGSATVAFP